MPDAKNERPWIDYVTQRPKTVGMYQWRVSSVAVPGLIVLVTDTFRVRGAGYASTTSPNFDHWDGCQVHVPSGLRWREMLKGDPRYDVEGIVLAPCPYCRVVPTWSAMQQGVYGTTINPHPQHLNKWSARCCEWGSTPWRPDPRQIAATRDAAFAAMRTPQEVPGA